MRYGFFVEFLVLSRHSDWYENEIDHMCPTL